MISIFVFLISFPFLCSELWTVRARVFPETPPIFVRHMQWLSEPLHLSSWNLIGGRKNILPHPASPAIKILTFFFFFVAKVWCIREISFLSLSV